MRSGAPIGRAGRSARSTAPLTTMQARPHSHNAPFDRASPSYSDIYAFALNRCGSKSAVFGDVSADAGSATVTRIHRQMAGQPVVESIEPDRGSDVERDDHFDFIHLRAEIPAAVERDIAAWWSKLRAGGMLSGQAYRGSVKDTVDAFVTRHGLRDAFRAGGGMWLLHKSIPIDAAYCINLATRTDRRCAAERRFEKVGLAKTVEFFQAIDGRTIRRPNAIRPGQAGCTASHMAVLRKAQERGARHVLIIEDDVVFDASFTTAFPVALSRCPSSYDLFYLGAGCRADWGCYLHPFTDVVSRAGRVLATTAYFVNIPAIASALHRDLDSAKHVIDVYMAGSIQPRGDCYVCTPYLVNQAPGHSDVTGAFRDPRDDSHYVWSLRRGVR